jgi:hypothetical protein
MKVFVRVLAVAENDDLADIDWTAVENLNEPFGLRDGSHTVELVCSRCTGHPMSLIVVGFSKLPDPVSTKRGQAQGVVDPKPKSDRLESDVIRESQNFVSKMARRYDGHR